MRPGRRTGASLGRSGFWKRPTEWRRSIGREPPAMMTRDMGGQRHSRPKELTPMAQG